MVSEESVKRMVVCYLSLLSRRPGVPILTLDFCEEFMCYTTDGEKLESSHQSCEEEGRASKNGMDHQYIT